MTAGHLGRILVVEGLDGCGKSTVAQQLAAVLDADLLTTPTAELRAVRPQFDAAFRESPAAHSLACGATVVEAGQRALRQVQEGRTVVIDRYWLSTLVYAPDPARPALVGMEPLIRAADLTFYLHAPLVVRQRRLGSRARVTEHDRRTLDPSEDARLAGRYQALGAHPLAGTTVPLDVSPPVDQVVRAMIAALAWWEARSGAVPEAR